MKNIVSEEMVEGLAFWDTPIDGEEINSGSVYVLENFDPANPNLAGRRVVEYKTVNADLIKPFIAMHKEGKLHFPFKAKVVFSMITGKSKQVLKVTEFSMLQPVPQQKTA